VAGAPLKVLYIAGVSHCGSTFLGSLLGQADGVIFVGELCHTARALEREQVCGCSRLLRDCPFWAPIFARVDTDALRLDHADERARAVVRHALADRGVGKRSPRVERSVREFATTLSALAETTGARVVVDSSKSPAYGRLLESAPGIELYVLHVVRDPRGTAWSWQKATDLHWGPYALSLIWDFWNPMIELLWSRSPRYMRLRYEDFARHPRDAVRRIFELLGEDEPSLPFREDGSVELGVTHSIAGNPGRVRHGVIPIRVDDEWRRRPELRGRRAVGLLTLPMRLRYGHR